LVVYIQHHPYCTHENTTSEVEPVLMNGSGKPVGGMEPVMTSYCTKNYL